MRIFWARVIGLSMGLAGCLAGCLEEEKTFAEQGAEVGSIDSGGGHDLGLVETVAAVDVDVDAHVSSSDETDTAIAPEVADADVTGNVEIDSMEEETTPEVFSDVEPDVQDVALDATVVDADADEISDIDVEEDTEVAMEIAPDVSETTGVDVEIIEDVEVVDVPPDVQDDIQDIATDATEVAVEDVVAEIDAAEIDAPEVVSDVDDVSEVDSVPETDSSDVPEVDIQTELPPPDPCLTLNCDDKNPCTLDSCDKVVGCSNAPTAATCEDGNACTVGDACALGSCKTGATKKCNDGNLCTTDSCDSKLGCVFANNVLPCEDGDICTEGEKCGNGACVAGQAKNCSDGNICTKDVCDQVKGCVNDPVTGFCDDGNICTSADVCAAGVCLSGAAKTCDDGDACTSNVCDAVMGCKYPQNWVVYDWKSAPMVPTNWKLGGSMLITCDLVYEFKGNPCVLMVPKGAPAFSTSFAELDLDKVRSSYSMGSVDLKISYWWGRYQSVNTGDTMTGKLIDGLGKELVSVSHSGMTGAIDFQEFTVDQKGSLFRIELVLAEKPLLIGPAVWDKVWVTPVGCTPKQ